jgi:membrane protease YdiL (CAAX protease family)
MLLSPLNHLFEMARTGKRLPHVLLAVPMSIVMVLLAQLTGGVLALLLIVGLSMATLEGNMPESPEAWSNLVLPDTALEQTILLVLAFGPIFLLLWGWLAFVEKRPFWTIGVERDGAVWKYIRGVLVGLLMFGSAVAISAALGYVEFEQGDPQKQGLPALFGVLLVYLGWTIQGPAEEALTRGWLMPVIGARYRPWIGVLISSLLFAFLHSLNPNLSLIAMLNLFLFGLFAAVYALYEGGLWGVFSIHAVWNWIQGNLLGFEVSGNVAPGGTLFNLREIGPDMITGGSFGPEGGLAVTVVLLLGIAIVVLLSQRATPVSLTPLETP